jgi:ADP-ribose pyrophosphatase YjhB (NUDIX family)
MNYTLLGKIWRRMPGRARWRLIRMSQPTFTVSAGAVVLNRNDEVLLLDHILRPGSGWGIPGGFLDRGEQPEMAIRRELMEETGVELRDVRLVKAHTVYRHIEFLYAARSDDDPQVLSPEITELGWFGPGKLPEGLPHAHAKIIEAVWRGEI